MHVKSYYSISSVAIIQNKKIINIFVKPLSNNNLCSLDAVKSSKKTGIDQRAEHN